MPRRIDPKFAVTGGLLISQEELDRITPKEGQPGFVHPNPCVKLFGKGPEGKTCKGCAHLVRMQYAHTILKCDMREDLTHGKATDQKAGWQACGKYEEGKNRELYMK